MASLNWCLNIKNGIELIKPNENMAHSYMKMAEESLKIIKKIDESKLWTASATYYTMYYCLYALMIKIGIKSEIHKCSITVMKECLTEFYDSSSVDFLETAFQIRNDLQYYPRKFIDNYKLELIKSKAPDFFIHTKQIISRISEKEINNIRLYLSQELKKS